MNTMNTRTEVVQDVLENLNDSDKEFIRSRPKEDLAIEFLNNLGWEIRIKYKMSENQALLADIGEENPDDASMAVIQDVWKALKKTETQYDHEPDAPTLLKELTI